MPAPFASGASWPVLTGESTMQVDEQVEEFEQPRVLTAEEITAVAGGPYVVGDI